MQEGLPLGHQDIISRLAKMDVRIHVASPRGVQWPTAIYKTFYGVRPCTSSNESIPTQPTHAREVTVHTRCQLRLRRLAYWLGIALAYSPGQHVHTHGRSAGPVSRRHGSSTGQQEQSRLRAVLADRVARRPRTPADAPGELPTGAADTLFGNEKLCAAMQGLPGTASCRRCDRRRSSTMSAL